MGFKFAYHRFFSVVVKEETTENEIRALEFSPTLECTQLLINHNLLFRNTRDGFEVFYRSNPNASEPITSPIDVKTKFSFKVKVRNSNIYEVYKPDVMKLPQFYLDNLTGEGDIITDPEINLTAADFFDIKDLAIINQQSFTQRTDMTGGDPPTEWRIKKKFIPQDIIKTIPIDNPDGLDFVEVRMNDPLLNPSEYMSESGVYSLETDKPSFEEATLYLSDDLGGSSVNGVLDIYWDNSQDNAPALTGKQYQIIFKLK
ncbi:MAG: hypothetical protein AAGA77_03410 [Bacteroidota bacterium]